MRKLMALRHQTAIVFCCMIFIITGCATSNKVNAALLEQNKSKTFKVGIIKAEGNPMAGFFGSSGIEYKKKALDNIPILEICSILTNRYSITIDANVDKTSRGVKEGMGYGGAPSNNPGFFIRLQPSTENAYYGNLEYENASTASIMFGGSSHITNSTQYPDVINVTYLLNYDAFGFKTSFRYDITIRSSDQDMVTLHGIVASISTPKKYGFGDQEAVWNSYVEYAGRISEALKRDLDETANK